MARSPWQSTEIAAILASSLLLVACSGGDNSGYRRPSQPAGQGAVAAPTQSQPARVESSSGQGTDGNAPGIPELLGETRSTPSGLRYIDERVGEGATPQNGQNVSVRYTGWLTDGSKFDSSLDRGQPFGFPLGAGRVIRGWDEGVASMKVGGKRRLIIPPELGYGSQGTAGGPIPPNATLIFDVELLAVQ